MNGWISYSRLTAEDARPAQLAAAQLCDYLAENEMQGKNAQKSIMRMTGCEQGMWQVHSDREIC